jgi:hypothetical protein
MQSSSVPSKITAAITEHSVWGEGLFIWAVYRVDVVYGSDPGWGIYRRFSHFMSLQSELTKAYGEIYMAPYLSILMRSSEFSTSVGEIGKVADTLWQNTGNT